MFDSQADRHESHDKTTMRTFARHLARHSLHLAQFSGFQWIEGKGLLEKTWQVGSIWKSSSWPLVPGASAYLTTNKVT